MSPENDAILLNAVSCTIKRLREKKYFGYGGQKKIAEEFGINPIRWREWEAGKKLPSDVNQRKLAAFFGVSLAELRGDAPAHSQEDSNHSNSELFKVKTQLEYLEKKYDEMTEKATTLGGENLHLRDQLAQLKTENERLHLEIERLREESKATDAG